MSYSHYKFYLIFIATSLLFNKNYAQTLLAEGEQPQISVSNNGHVRVVYGVKEKIFVATSNDSGKTFSIPILVGTVAEMHLGMTRGPQLASSKDFSIVTAMDKLGNIHCFQLNHKTDTWTKVQAVNDLRSSAPEGLMSIAADDDNNFYAVWLDQREGKNNNICFSTWTGTAGWSTNRFIYRSPEGHVCECCQPSIIAKGNSVSVMFRNWLKGARDLYLISSTNRGKDFSEAQKLGFGTWPLKGCPMDGGGITYDKNNNIHTAWQREGLIYYSDPGTAERMIGEGRNVSIAGNIVSWEKSSILYLSKANGEPKKIAEGTALQVSELSDKSILMVWEKDGEIWYKKIDSHEL